MVYPIDITINCDESTLSSNTGEATATDNCNTPEVTESDEVIPGDCDNEMVIERTWTATDDCGNETSQVQLITVVDDEAPSFTCPDDLTLELGEEVPAQEVLTATDNCDDDVTVSVTEEHHRR